MAECEWNPQLDRPAFVDDEELHGEATVMVGSDGKWHLCASCAALPRFARFKQRPLQRRVPERAQRKRNRQLASWATPPEDHPAMSQPQECSCVGHCRGREGLSERFLCVVEQKRGKVPFNVTPAPGAERDQQAGALGRLRAALQTVYDAFRESGLEESYKQADAIARAALAATVPGGTDGD